MSYPRVLTIQDISCVGQCSLTAALPVISACGVEACPIPSAVLSTHTAGFKNFTFRDLTDDMPLIKEHWIREGIKFDAIYTGYLGSAKQISYVKDIMASVVKDGGVAVIDPAMADNGKLYLGFDMAFVEEMKKLCALADYLIPNITEASLLTGIEYKTEYDEKYIRSLLNALTEMGCKNIILTGVSYAADTTGVVIYENGNYSYYNHEKIERGCHGTGDVYASAFVGALMRGKTACDAARIAADYTLLCIKETLEEPEHWYGVKFEPVLGKLIDALK
ncbi:MAG: pyridoxamine kinase [Clostridia bacterium]|nr:pyridoxamine kinase [Clostridia bacterium]